MTNRSGMFPLIHAKDHPVLDPPAPWSVDDVRVSLPDEGDGACVLLLVRRDRTCLRLQFDGVTDLTLLSGRPASPVRILDVTHIQWHGVTVRVETASGDLGFWAGSVVALDAEASGHDTPSRRSRRPTANGRVVASRRRSRRHEA